MSTTERQWHRDPSDDDSLSRSVAVELRTVTDIAWDRAPHWGKKKKKLASEANREVIWGGKGPFPCLFPPLGSLVPGYFRYQACRNHHSLCPVRFSCQRHFV